MQLKHVICLQHKHVVGEFPVYIYNYIYIYIDGWFEGPALKRPSSSYSGGRLQTWFSFGFPLTPTQIGFLQKTKSIKDTLKQQHIYWATFGVHRNICSASVPCLVYLETQHKD